ncbi:TPA: hypothetical protein ACYLK8_007253 [Burkholderia cenocepacia]
MVDRIASGSSGWTARALRVKPDATGRDGLPCLPAPTRYRLTIGPSCSFAARCHSMTARRFCDGDIIMNSFSIVRKSRRDFSGSVANPSNNPNTLSMWRTAPSFSSSVVIAMHRSDAPRLPFFVA